MLIVETLEAFYREPLRERLQVPATMPSAVRMGQRGNYFRDARLKAFMRSANADAVVYFARGLEVVNFPGTVSEARVQAEVSVLAVRPSSQTTTSPASRGGAEPPSSRLQGTMSNE